MAWKETNAMKERIELIEEYFEEEKARAKQPQERTAAVAEPNRSGAQINPTRQTLVRPAQQVCTADNSWYGPPCMAKESAGLLMYRVRDGSLEFLLAHPGGPFWKGKDAGVWTIPKGEIQPGEAPMAAAQREFEEELGFKPEGNFVELTPVKQKAGKLVHAWAFEGDCDPSLIRSNTFSMEWPPRSGKTAEFPEIDRAAFLGLSEAKEKVNPAQIAFLEEIVHKRIPGS